MITTTRLLQIKTVGIVVKYHQVEAAELAEKVAVFLNLRGVAVCFADENQVLAEKIAQRLPQKRFTQRDGIELISKKKLAQHCDLIVVFGGDGTFISAARCMGKSAIPLMGVNMGQLGFLTEIKKEEALSVLERLLEGVPAEVRIRPLLEVALRRTVGKTKDKVVFRGPVVNDAVISKGAIARIIGLQVWVNQHWIHELRADGIIVSTTTGSTAYALAAGGPIVEPSVAALVLAPICPHSLTMRPLVISDTSEVRLCLTHRPGHVFLTLDGQDVVDLKEGDQIIVKKNHQHSLQWIASTERDYFGLLREKFQFGVRD